MPDIFVHPGKLTGSVNVPPSKSMTHRAVICSALAGDISLLTGDIALAGDLRETNLSRDIHTTIEAMNSLLSGGREIFCDESGSTLRFLIPVAAALGKNVTFTGAGRLPIRPLNEYLAIFEDKGVSLEFPADKSLPLSIKGQLIAGHFRVPGDVSSQYITGLLLALPLLHGDSEIEVTSALESAAYVDMTLQVMKHFGVTAVKVKNSYLIHGGQQYGKVPFAIEGDYSQAAFWLTANYLGSDITLSGLDEKSAQGDKEIIWILKIFENARKDTGKNDKEETEIEIEIDASQIPDLVPIIAVAAANTKAITRIVNAGRLRLKESDRLDSTKQMISNIGGNITETPDGLIIHGGIRLTGGTVDSFGDHRISMAAGIAALSTRNGITITKYDCVDKSYPSFFDDFKKAGGVCNELDLGKQD